MIDYIYDDTFEGLLTCIHYNYYQEKASGIYSGQTYQPNFFHGHKEIATDEEKAIIVYDAIESKISSSDLRRVYRTFLSSVQEKENMILDYIKLGFKVGHSVNALHGNSIVFQVQQADRKVTAEVHRLLGLIRFNLLTSHEEEILYANIEPDHDVCELLAPHFTDRFYYDPFIIHDTGRKKALIANGGDWYLSQFTHKDLEGYSKDLSDFPSLWKSYFENIAIKERINPKCQKRCMPVRYWKNLTEMQLNR